MLSFNKRDTAAVSHAGSITEGKPQLQGGERGAAGQLPTAGQRPQGGWAPLGPAVAIDLRWRAWRLSLGQPASSKGHRCGAAHTSCSMHTVGVSTHPGAPYPLSVWATVNTHHRRQQGRNSTVTVLLRECSPGPGVTERFIHITHSFLT